MKHDKNQPTADNDNSHQLSSSSVSKPRKMGDTRSIDNESGTISTQKYISHDANCFHVFQNAKIKALVLQEEGIGRMYADAVQMIGKSVLLFK